MRLLILSDIHGNLSALNAVLQDAESRFQPEVVILLGDSIDYGPQSNEVVAVLKKLKTPVLCSIWGNHEHAIMNRDYSRFSSERGVQCAKRTETILSKETRRYLQAVNGKLGKPPPGRRGSFRSDSDR